MYGIVSDIHCHNWSAFSGFTEKGENTRLRHIRSALEEAGVVMDRQRAKRMYIAGDLFHVRGSIAPSVLNPVMETFKYLIDDLGLDVRIIPGNHDLESNDSSQLTNATQALASMGCTICTETMAFSDDKVVMMPWIPKLADLKREMREWGKKHPKYDLIIHAPLNGVIAGIPDHGLDPSELTSYGFNRVFVGHYHNHKAFCTNTVISIGALTHQTWSDVNTKAGFLLVGDGFEHRETSAPKFVDYDEKLDDSALKDLCAGNYVRIKMGSATEKEITEIREYVQKDLGARGVNIIATPKMKTPTRSASIKSGASLQQSISDHVRDGGYTVDQKALEKECLEILNESETGAND